MSLDPLIAQILAGMANDPPVYEEPIELSRQRIRDQIAGLPPSDAVLSKVENIEIHIGDRVMAARHYRPRHSGAPMPLILYFHGGGWSRCDLDTHDGQCRRLCAEAGMPVLSLDYRLAPEYSYPAQFDDCRAAYEWCLTQTSRLGANEGRIILAGDSAGGNLAAGLALALRDEGGVAPLGQILLYPGLAQPDAGMGSYEAFAEGFGLTKKSAAHYWRLYMGDAAITPYNTPMAAADFSQLPPAFIVTAEYDVLRDEAERFAAHLIEAGGEAVVLRVNGAVHAFLALESIWPPARAAFEDAGVWAKQLAARTH